MNDISLQPRSIVIERLLPHPPEKVWRALTQPHLMADWLMRGDFAPTVGHHFQLTADWGAVDCEVLALEANRSLVYAWRSSGLDSVVTWTLTPAETGTRLRMEQTGFRADQPHFYEGARAGWPHLLDRLDALLSRAD